MTKDELFQRIVESNEKKNVAINEIIDQCFQLFKTWLWGGYYTGKFEYDCCTLFDLLKEFNPALANHYVKEMMDDWKKNGPPKVS